MAGETDTSVAPPPDPREALQKILRTIRGNALQVAFTTLVAVMAGIALAMVWPEKYESMTQFVLREQHVVDDSAILSDLEDISLPDKMRTLENELKSHKRIGAVLDELQWVEYLETASSPARRRDLILTVAKNLTVEMDPDPTGAHNITLTFQWTDPRKAADFVNRLRDHWITLTIESHRKRLYDQLNRAVAILAERDRAFQEALAEVQRFEQENDTPGLLSLEVNQEMQGQLEVELVAAQAALDAAAIKVETLRAQLATHEKKIPEIVELTDPEQAAAMTSLKAAEAKLEDLQAKYTDAHPKVIAAKQAVETAREKLAELGGPVDTAARTITVDNPRYVEVALELAAAEEEELAAAALVRKLEDQLREIENRLRRLPKVAQELARLNAEVEERKKLLAQARQQIQPLQERVGRLRSVELSSADTLDRIAGSPFEILDLGVEPEDPTLPIGPVILALALLGGLGLGVALPVVSDMLRTSFTSLTEVSRTLGVPVLGSVDLILTARDVRARTVQQVLTVMTMALVLAALGLALYIYAFHPEVLPATLVRQLRDLRMALT